jgi:hypothetical protein
MVMILAHLWLWAFLTCLIAALVEEPNGQPAEPSSAFVVGGFMAAMLIIAPISLVAVVRFWWGN